MMKMSDIRRRLIYKKLYNQEKMYNPQITIASAKYGNTNNMNNVLNEWKVIKSNEKSSLRETLKILEMYESHCNNNSDKKFINNIFKTNVIPSITNYVNAEDVFKEFNRKDLIEECKFYKKCDRILNNQKKLNKVLNFDKFVKSFNFNNENIDEFIFESCNKIDEELQCHRSIKYNLCLENIMYCLDKKGVDYSKSYLLESITDYFLLNMKNEEDIDGIKFVIEKTDYYTEVNQQMLDSIEEKKLFDLDKAKDIKDHAASKIRSFINKIYTKSDTQIIEELPSILGLLRRCVVFATFGIHPYIGLVNLMVDKFISLSVNRTQIKKFISKYKSELEKANKKYYACSNEHTKQKYKTYIKTLEDNISKLEEYQDSLYSDKQNTERIENDMKCESYNLFATKDDVVTAQLDRSLDRYLFKRPIDLNEYLEEHHIKVIAEAHLAIINLINNIKIRTARDPKLKNVFIPIDDTELKYFENGNNISKYLKDDNITFEIGYCLPFNYSKNMDREFNTQDKDYVLKNLYEICDIIEDKLHQHYMIYFEGEEDYYRIYLVYSKSIINDLNNIDDDILESANYINELSNVVENIYDDKYNHILQDIEKNLPKYDNDIIKNIAKFSQLNKEIIDPENLADVCNEAKKVVYNNDKSNLKYLKASVLSESVNITKTNAPVVKFNKNRFEILEDLKNINNALESIYEINNLYSNSDDNILLELSFTNTLKLAKEKLAKSVTKMSDATKSVSRQIDTGLSTFNKSVQDSLSSDNRENIIKGRVLPSASKIIKLAIISGVLYFVHPALSVITVLGSLGASAGIRHKEKQMILDEIDIELKLTEKKIQLAESNGDMKALEQLLKIEKKLKREKQRIMYTIKDVYVTSEKE